MSSIVVESKPSTFGFSLLFIFFRIVDFCFVLLSLHFVALFCLYCLTVYHVAAVIVFWKDNNNNRMVLELKRRYESRDVKWEDRAGNSRLTSELNSRGKCLSQTMHVMMLLQEFSTIEWSWSAISKVDIKGPGMAAVWTCWTWGSWRLLSTVYGGRVWSVDRKYYTGDFEVTFLQNILVVIVIFRCWKIKRFKAGYFLHGCFAADCNCWIVAPSTK